MRPLIVLSRSPLAASLVAAFLFVGLVSTFAGGPTSFNLLLLPKDPFGTLPEEYAARVTNLRLLRMERVQPILQQNLSWPEQRREIRLVGIRVERPMRGGDAETALDPVPAGAVALGFDLCRAANRKVGDRAALLGRTFTVARCEPARNDKDEDNTAWLYLKDAQELLGQNGRINGVIVTNAHAPSDRLGRIRAEIAELLPETQVIELGTDTLAQAEARDRQASSAPTGISWETVALLGAIAAAGAAVWFGSRNRRTKVKVG